jgi:hypothetical protein
LRSRLKRAARQVARADDRRVFGRLSVTSGDVRLPSRDSCWRLARLGGTIRQVKEKFGQLCFYYRLPFAVSDDDRRALALRVRRAEAMSIRICERCGSRTGELVCDGGLYLTACTARREARRMQTYDLK